MQQLARLTSKLSAIACATILAAVVSAWAKEGETRTCETKLGGQVVCGDLVIGITLEQYEAGLKKRAEEIRAEEAEKRIQLQKLVELTERATSAEKDSLRRQIAAVEAEKRALEAESKGVAERLTNLQTSYDGLVQKLGEANAALEAFAPLISKDAFDASISMAPASGPSISSISASISMAPASAPASGPASQASQPASGQLTRVPRALSLYPFIGASLHLFRPTRAPGRVVTLLPLLVLSAASLARKWLANPRSWANRASIASIPLAFRRSC